MNEELELSLDDFQEDVPVEETTEETTEVEVQDNPETTEPDPLAQATYDKYVELGIIDEDEEFDGTFEYIEQKMEELPKKALQQALDQLPQESQAVLQFIATAGKNVDKKELFDFVKQWYTEEQTEFETEDEARTFLETKLKAQGLGSKSIQVELDDLEDDGKLLEKANKLLKEDGSKSSKSIEAKAAQNQQIKQQQQQFYSSIAEELKTLNYSKKKTEQIQTTIPKANQILSEVIKNPKAYVQLIDVLSTFNGKEFNFDTFVKQGESKAVSSIKQAMEKSGVSSAASGTKATTLGKLLGGDRYEVVI